MGETVESAVPDEEVLLEVFYDSWLETIRIGLLSGLLPDPTRDFSRYWNTIRSIVKPAYLASPPVFPEHGMMDSLFDFRMRQNTHTVRDVYKRQVQQLYGGGSHRQFL